MNATPINRPMIHIENLDVNYGTFSALKNVTLSVPPGCVGLLGPNGAGKTTLIKTLLGFVKPTRGTAEVLGKSISKQGALIRQLVGLMPEQECHLPGMSGVHYVSYAGELCGMPRAHALRRAHEVLEYVGLGEARYRNVETYSTGMKQRAKLAQALVHGPKILLLDEPTNGLDPKGRNEMLELIRRISSSGLVQVLLCSHLLKDIERTCDTVIVMNGGTVRAVKPIHELMKVDGQPIDIACIELNASFMDKLISSNCEIIREQGHTLRILSPFSPEETTKLIFRAALFSEVQVRSIEPARRTLEEAFMEVIA